LGQLSLLSSQLPGGPSATAALGLTDPSLVGGALLALAAWVALARSRPRSTAGGIEAAWADFRQAYGLLWAVRVRERFETAMRASGCPLRLEPSGWIRSAELTAVDEQAAERLLESLLSRFVEPRWWLPDVGAIEELPASRPTE